MNFLPLKIIVKIMLLGTLLTHATTQSGDPTINTAKNFLAQIGMFNDDASNLLTSIMSSLLIEYQNTKLEEANLRHHKIILANQIKMLAMHTQGFPLRAARLVILERIKHIKPQYEFNHEKLHEIMNVYESITESNQKILILSILHVLTCIDKITEPKHIIEKNMKILLDLCKHNNKTGFFTWRDKERERKVYNAFTELSYIIRKKIKTPQLKIAFQEAFNSLGVLKLACMQECNVLSETGFTTRNISYKTDHFNYYVKRSSRVLQTYLAYLDEFDESHPLALSLFIAEQQQLLNDKEKYISHLSQKEKAISILTIIMTTLYMLTYCIYFYVQYGESTRIPFLEKMQNITNFLFSFSLFSNILTILGFTLSWKKDHHILST